MICLKWSLPGFFTVMLAYFPLYLISIWWGDTMRLGKPPISHQTFHSPILPSIECFLPTTIISMCYPNNDLLFSSFFLHVLTEILLWELFFLLFYMFNYLFVLIWPLGYLVYSRSYNPWLSYDECFNCSTCPRFSHRWSFELAPLLTVTPSFLDHCHIFWHYRMFPASLVHSLGQLWCQLSLQGALFL